MKSLAQMSAAELKESGQRDAIPHLIRCLSSDDTPERCIATLGLIQFAEQSTDDVEDAVPDLIKMAKDELHRVRRHALKSLRVLADCLSETQQESIRALADHESRESNRRLIDDILSAGSTVSQNGHTSAARTSKSQSDNAGGLRIGIGHLYTTGSNLGRDAVFHVGGISFTNASEPQIRDWIIDPERPITIRLVDKTRINNPRIEGRPTWRDQRATIRKFFEELDVLFVFNLHGEREWFKRHVLRGAARRPAIIDLHEMARFFLPERTFYDQRELIKLGVPDRDWAPSEPRLPYFLMALSRLLQDVLSSITAPLSADDDRAVVLSLLNQALNPSGPADFEWMRRVATDETIRWTAEFPKERFSYRVPEQPLPTDHVTGWIKSNLPEPSPRTEHDVPRFGERDEGNSRTLTDSDVELAFEHLRKLEVVDHRSEQIDYAKFIGSAVTSGGHFAIEAGTGTGKTLGYLVPAAEYVLRNPSKKVIIATATKNLQGQILARELAKVTTRRSKYQDLRGALYKGKVNYICLSALAKQYARLFLSEGESSRADERLVWLHLAILCARADGDLEAQTISVRFQHAFLKLRDEVNASEHCTNELCGEGTQCIYPRVRAQANDAHIIATNHYKLATLDDELIKSAGLCIIDEADQFPDNFRNSLAVEITWRDVVFRFARRLRTQSDKRRGFGELASDHFEERLEKEPGNETFVSGAAACKQIIAACDQLHENARAIHDLAPRPGQWEMRWQQLAPEALENLMQSLQNLFDASEKIVHELTTLERLSDSDAFLAKRKDQLTRYLFLGEETKEKIQELCFGYDREEYVHTIGSGWTLKRIPMHIWGALKEKVASKVTATVFTSATLYVEQSLQLFEEELSLENGFTRHRRIESPFDYAKHVLGFVATSLHRYDFNADKKEREAWAACISEAVAQLVEPVYGRSLILFTNTREMRTVHRLVKRTLEESDVEVLIQNGTSLLEISTFRSVEHSVLFGVDRFWTGVDFPGPTLSQVIVVRSPNPNLGDPLIEHRLRYMRDQFWDRFYHPTARLKMRQGFGRLMRSEKDRGAFVVLDSRIVDDGPIAGIEEDLPISLNRAPDIGVSDERPSETVSRILAHLRLTKEYEVRRPVLPERLIPLGRCTFSVGH